MGTPGVDVFQAIDLVAAAGMDGIELRSAADGVIHEVSFTPDLGARVLEHAKQAGLEICSVCPYYQDYVAAREKTIAGVKLAIDMAAALECPVVRISAGRDRTVRQAHGALSASKGNEGLTPDEARGLLADALREVGDYAASRGVTGAIETHVGTLCYTSAETLDMIQRVNHPAIRVCLDWAFIAQAGHDTVESCFARLAPYIVHVHAKDFAGRGPDDKLGRQTILGEGDLGWPEVIRKLVEIGYDGFLSDEFEKYWKPELPEPEDWFPRSRAAMSRLVADATRGL